MTYWLRRAALVFALLVPILIPIAAQNSGTDTLSSYQTEWPSYLGPHGNFGAGYEGSLIEDMTEARLLWESEEQCIGFGKTWIGSFPRVSLLFGDLPPGGVASPIVADGLVIQSSFTPSGIVWDHYIEKTLPEEEFVKRRWLISADDIILAIDATTGKTRWKKVFEDRGMNLVSIKYGGWGITPTAYNGRLFSIGTTGRVYCLDLHTGELLWESTVGARHLQLEALRTKALDEQRLAVGNGRDRPRITLLGGLVVIGGVLIAPDLNQGLIGFETHTGRTLWHLQGNITSEYNMPFPVRLKGQPYVATVNASGEMRLIRPGNGKVLWTCALGSQHLTQAIAGQDHLLVFDPNPAFEGDPVKNPPEEQAATDLAARWAGVNRYGVLAAYRFDERGAYRDWALPARYVHQLHMDGGSDRSIIARDGLVYYINQTNNPSKIRRLMIIRESDGKILVEEEVDVRHIWLWGDRLVTSSDIVHRPDQHRPEIWQLYDADPEHFRALGSPWRINDPDNPVHTATGGYEVPVYAPFAQGLMYCRTVGGIRCYDLRE